MQLEVVEGDLGEVVDEGGDLAGDRVGFERADELGVDAEAIGDHEEAVLIAGFGLADVDRAVERAVEGRGADRKGADLAIVGAVGRALRAEVGLRVEAGALAVGGVGVDRQAVGQGEGRGCDRTRGCWRSERLGGGEVRSRPAAESAALVVGLPSRTGLKVIASQPVVAG